MKEYQRLKYPKYSFLISITVRKVRKSSRHKDKQGHMKGVNEIEYGHVELTSTAIWLNDMSIYHTEPASKCPNISPLSLP